MIVGLEEFQENPCGLFIGWQDEQHDQQPSLRKSEYEQTLTSIDRLNQTQDPSDLHQR
jgi:hypothetical protein